MQPTMRSPMMASKGKSWTWVIAAVVVAAIAVLAWWWYVIQLNPYPIAPENEVLPSLAGGDTVGDIEQDLGAVDLGNVDQELNELDKDINQL